MIVMNSLAPLVLIVMLGWTLRRTGFTPRPFFQATSRLVYWVGLPCLLFDKTSSAEAAAGPAFRVFMVMGSATLGCVAVAYAVAWAMGVRRRAVGTFVQGAYRGNLAYVGLAVILFAVGDDKSLAATAAVALAPLVPIYNILAVAVLLAGHPHEVPTIGRGRAMVIKMFTNPLLLACVAGLCFAVTGVEVPVVIHRACAGVGQMALPLALLGIGATLAFRHFTGAVVPAVAAALIKTVAAPLLGLAAAHVFGATGGERQIALVYLACPTAVASFVMAGQLGGDEQLAGGIILVSLLTATASLAVVLLLT